MTDYLWPPDIIPSSQTWGVLDPAGMFTSPLSGAVRTVSRPGARLRCMVTVPPIKGRDRRRLMAMLSSLRGRSNRLLMPDYSVTKEGSFGAAELLTNGGFSNGTTGWSAGAEYSISASDRVLRAKVISPISGGTVTYPTSTATATQYAPYAGRVFTTAGAGAYPSGFRIGLGSTASGNEYGTLSSTSHGMRTLAAVPSGTALGINLTDLSTAGSGTMAGDYVNVELASLSRCALVDNGPNALLRSDQFDNASWTKTEVTVAGDNIAGPTGAVIADAVLETTATSTHELRQSVTVASAAADYCLAIAIKPNSRSFVQLALEEGTGGTDASAFFNLTSGAVGTIANGANWANTRGFSRDLGNGWWYICIVSRKTNAATSLLHRVLLSTDGSTVSYTGVAAVDAAYVWRATSAQSSVPVRLTQTTTTATTGTSQTGRSLYVKGLPASTQGLLRFGDPVQLGTQINFVAADVDSDAAGLGLLTVGLPWRNSPADNDPVIVNTPMAKMILASEDISWDTGPGQFSPFQIELVEDVE
jgi:hypothetical protein